MTKSARRAVRPAATEGKRSRGRPSPEQARDQADREQNGGERRQAPSESRRGEKHSAQRQPHGLRTRVRRRPARGDSRSGSTDGTPPRRRGSAAESVTSRKGIAFIARVFLVHRASGDPGDQAEAVLRFGGLGQIEREDVLRFAPEFGSWVAVVAGRKREAVLENAERHHVERHLDVGIRGEDGEARPGRHVRPALGEELPLACASPVDAVDRGERKTQLLREGSREEPPEREERERRRAREPNRAKRVMGSRDAARLGSPGSRRAPGASRRARRRAPPTRRSRATDLPAGGCR